MSTSSPPTESSNTVRNFIHSIVSYDSNVMLAAIISLLLVILFVLLLHIYAKWFLVQARHRSENSVSVPHVLGARFRLETSRSTTPPTSPIKGLSRSVISSIPLFVYKGKTDDHEEKGLECTICLSLFEDEDVCRKLQKCKHAFHVDCIDMWLFSHSTCPICRAPVVHDLNKKIVEFSNTENEDRTSSTNQELVTSSNVGDQEETVTFEIIVDVPNDGAETNENRLNIDDPLSVSSSSSSSGSSLTSSLGGSLRRMLSRNTSERRKVPPSSNVN